MIHYWMQNTLAINTKSACALNNWPVIHISVLPVFLELNAGLHGDAEIRYCNLEGAPSRMIFCSRVTYVTLLTHSSLSRTCSRYHTIPWAAETEPTVHWCVLGSLAIYGIYLSCNTIIKIKITLETLIQSSSIASSCTSDCVQARSCLYQCVGDKLTTNSVVAPEFPLV